MSKPLHEIVMTTTDDGISDFKVVCNAPADAYCRTYPNCYCESYPCAHENESVTGQDCLVLPWFNEPDDPSEWLPAGLEMRAPVEAIWNVDHCILIPESDKGTTKRRTDR